MKTSLPTFTLTALALALGLCSSPSWAGDELGGADAMVPHAAAKEPLPSPSPARPGSSGELYQSLGGAAGIARISDRLVDKLFADRRIAEFFKHSDKRGLSDILSEQFAYLSGGPKPYGGANMRNAHKDMGIGQSDFNALVEDLQDAMDEEGVPFRIQNKLLAILAPMHRDVVEKP